jgi:alkanesulfonate monooxygenase SsuD/methylene tetrahydromethanopterin reductase-like flavin-dependent oxidoreductase (luciferase family)
MKLGIYLNSQHPAGDDPGRRYAETLEQVRLIRSLGFDSVWAGEHHVTPGFHFFPQLPLLQSIAAAAEGLWIGTNVTLLPLHNPIELAEVGAFMDVLTGGKFLLGVGDQIKHGSRARRHVHFPPLGENDCGNACQQNSRDYDPVPHKYCLMVSR